MPSLPMKGERRERESMYVAGRKSIIIIIKMTKMLIKCVPLSFQERGTWQHGTHSHSEQRRRERTASYLVFFATLQRYTKPSEVEEGPGWLLSSGAARWGGGHWVNE